MTYSTWCAGLLAVSGVFAWSGSAAASDPMTYGQEAAMPAELPYHDGADIPAGYELDARSNKALVITGAATAGAFWVVTAITGVLIETLEFSTSLYCPLGRAVDDAVDSRDPDSSLGGALCSEKNHWPMLIPVAGPFITMSTADTEGGDTALLAVAGGGQIVGLGLLFIGLATGDEVLVRADVGEVELTVIPEIAEAPGLSIVGTF